MSLKQKSTSLINNSFYLYISYFSDYLMALFFLPFIARTVGTEEFGNIGIVQTLGIFFILLIEFGSTLTTTKNIARKRGNEKDMKKLLGEILTSRLILVPIVFVFAIIAISFFAIFQSNSKYVLIVVIGSILQGLSPNWYFQGVEKMKDLALSKFFSRILGFIIIFFFVKSPENAWIVLASYAFSNAMICIYLNFRMVTDLGTIKIATFIQSIKILRQSLHGFIIAVIPALYHNISVIVLSMYVNPYQLGLFYGANRVYRAFNSLFGPISQAFFPILASAKNLEQKKMLIKKYFTVIFTIGSFFCATLFFFSEQITFLLLGDQFVSSAKILKIFAVVLPLTAISNTFGRQWLISLDKERRFSRTQFVSFFTSIISLKFLVNEWGVLALPVSLIVYEISSIILILFFLKRAR